MIAKPAWRTPAFSFRLARDQQRARAQSEEEFIRFVQANGRWNELDCSAEEVTRKVALSTVHTERLSCNARARALRSSPHAVRATGNKALGNIQSKIPTRILYNIRYLLIADFDVLCFHNLISEPDPYLPLGDLVSNTYEYY